MHAIPMDAVPLKSRAMFDSSPLKSALSFSSTKQVQLFCCHLGGGRGGVDLVPREAVEAWLKYLRQFAPTIAFKCSTQRQSANLGQSRNRTMQSASSVCLGADNLTQLLKNYTRNANIKTAITVGLVGVPNVGKSSVINSLKRNKVSRVGNRPGKK